MFSCGHAFCVCFCDFTSYPVIFPFCPLDSKQGAEGSHEDVMEDEAEEGMEDKASGEGEEEDIEEDEPACDPLVFSREEFDAGE